MTGVIPKFLEGKPLPEGYYDAIDPYTLSPLSKYNLRAMLEYAESKGKTINDLTCEEAERFRVRE